MSKLIYGARFVLILSLVFSLPTGQLTAATMITTDQVVSDLAAERDRIASFLNRSDVQKRMVELGVSSAEASARVASLSDAEVKQAATQLDQLHAGGDGIYIGLGALIFILILFLILRH